MVEKRTAEREYHNIPELSFEDLAQFLGFTSRTSDSWSLFESTEQVFLDAIVEAIKNPSWLANPEWNENQPDNPAYGHPGPQKSNNLGACISNIVHSGMDLVELAQNINVHNSGLIYHSEPDIVARAIEKMGTWYPNLAIFRGTSFDIDRGFTGIDFAPGLLTTAIEYTNRSWRTNPVLVMATFCDVAKEYSLHRLSIATENNWWRNSLEIHRKYSAPRRAQDLSIFTIRRLSQDPKKVKELLQAYNDFSIKLL